MNRDYKFRNRKGFKSIGRSCCHLYVSCHKKIKSEYHMTSRQRRKYWNDKELDCGWSNTTLWYITRRKCGTTKFCFRMKGK